MKATRQEVYAAIDGERAYQKSLFVPGAKFGAPVSEDPDRPHTVGEEILLLNDYAQKAKSAWTDVPGTEAALNVVRKIAAIATRCLENHGAPTRG